MSRKFQLAIGISAVLPLFAAAQLPNVDAAAPDSGGLPISYRSAFAGYQPMQEPAEPSIERWRALNDEVARVGGHAGAIKDDASPENGAGGKEDASSPARMPQHQH